jgi:lipoprotein NlpI
LEGQFYRSLAITITLLAIGIFIVTPTAESFAHSDAFVPSLLGAIGTYALGTTINGWRNGRIEPLLRGFSRTFDREEQPVRYWASLGWNAALGCALLAGSVGTVHYNKVLRCDDSDDKGLLTEALEACDTLLAQDGLGEETRADLLAARGRVHDRLGADARALADYSAALDLEPNDSYALYNRAMIYARMGDLQRSIEDLDASLALRPDNLEAYFNRGLAFLDTGRPNKAIDDFTTLYERNPDHPYALANRGIAYAWTGNDRLAERDFAKLHPGDPGWPVVLRGRAVLAMDRQDYDRVIEQLSQALVLDPNDLFALRMRADAYWKTGQQDLARDDDDRSMKLEDGSRALP